jgi:hypothetical protein
MMEACSKNSNPDVLILGEELLTSLGMCNDRLREYVEKEEWTGSQEEARNRHALLEKLSNLLLKLDKHSQSEKVLALRRRIKWILEDLQNDNDAFLSQLREKISSSQERIKEIKKGRRAVGLYRKPGLVKPRFLNKMG